VVKEEVTVGKRVVQGTERVGGEVHREEVRVEREGDVDVREGEPDQK
jgi:stress response protein YsnF